MTGSDLFGPTFVPLVWNQLNRGRQRNNLSLTNDPWILDLDNLVDDSQNAARLQQPTGIRQAAAAIRSTGNQNLAET